MTAAAPFPPIRIMENEGDYRISLPAGQMDLRRISVFATPRSISIEIRNHVVVSHPDTACKELDEQRIVCEINLPQLIREGCTNVTPCGRELEIICLKEQTGEDRNWAEKLRFDTRSSIGSI